MSPFERLEELTDASITIEGHKKAYWEVFIRPYGGGFPLVRGESDSLAEAVKQAIALWEAK
ncbi:MAG: hypothetical protein V4563_17055 [Pseudomonadota bacterium]